MQPERQSVRSAELLRTAARTVPLVFTRNLRARRYILRVTDDGAARVTIPRGGSKESARLFAREHLDWVQGQLQRQALRPRPARMLSPGDEVFFRGRKMALRIEGGELRLGEHVVCPARADDCTLPVRGYLWRAAAEAFVPRTLELAKAHGLEVKRVMVRNQRSRWGSCSVNRTLCLNWRLIQAPPSVSDYLIVHELMHLREMNHSERFWRHVANACPRYSEAEQWLDDHDYLLRQG